MSIVPARGDLVIAINPCSEIEPSPRIVAAACAAGGSGVLDLAGGTGRALSALEQAAAWSAGPVGVRVSAGCAATVADVERAVSGRLGFVIQAADSPWRLADLVGRHRVLVEVTSLAEALEAATAGAYGLIARGSEAGGGVGELTSFVLLQQLLADATLTCPVWVAGGVGPHTAAACVLGGAAGVVLDSQLALMPESDLPSDVTAVIGRMDGSESVLVGHVRGIRRDGPPAGTAELLPVGQDGWLAALFLERWRDTATAVRGIISAITDATAADAEWLLKPGAPLADSLGVRIPVAQGPMTRVSDVAGFAAAVADDGALPFIALALASGEQSRRMLRETADELGERPWGVGVLGFAPEDVRAAQLEAVREVRPPVAIIAGGRPAQAKVLEAEGIAAFLHVPSPGLLRQFLRAGARRFVFEGSECGGHIGPRTSFALWEAQLTVLQEFLDGVPGEIAGQVQVFFAGGVHDARSAAMVAALAAPLARRGAQVGVLMGTAYLFTREAVRCGAIQPLFQRQVISARATAVLETAPGHVTRCLPSPFVEDFHRLRAELTTPGVPDRQVWERLEALNVGRLRIASKGRRREGDQLVAVDEAGQQREGLFMAGQVAMLRDAETTVAELHENVTAGAGRFHAVRVAALAQAAQPVEEQPAPRDIAIIGMACVLPGSPDLAAFWQTVLDGRDAVTEVPADRWDVETYYASEVGPAQVGRMTVSKWGAFLAPVPFDAIRYGVPPNALGSIDPTQLLVLEVAHRALVDAGYPYDAAGVDHSRTGVVFGAETGSDFRYAQSMRLKLPAYLGEVPPELDAQLPSVTEDSFPGVLANVIAGRVANRLDLRGPNFTVDAACASSLAAMDAARKELVAGTSDLMICGGADLQNGITDYLLFTSVRALSPTGRCRSFDANGDGIALGEGVACVVLKRLADAQRDGDRIYAVVKGVGAASDGRALGLTAPRAEGQRRALDRAYADSGVSPNQIGLVEAHGTGTVVGDRTELQTLTRLFTESGARPGSCALGSVKSQIGHTKCAAGSAGVIKAALALYTGVKPPTLHLTRPNPAWDRQTSPFVFHTEASPWSVPASERVAGVSAFGFGGANYHVVLAAYPGMPPRHTRDEWPAELFCFRGGDRAAAHQAIQKFLTVTRSTDRYGRPWRLRDLAATLARESDQRAVPVQITIVARDHDELDRLLRRALAGEHDPRCGLIQPPQQADAAGVGADGKVAFLFPGQGSQRPGALRELFVTFPELHQYLDLGRQWTDTLFPPAAFDPDTERDQQQRVRDTRVAQPVLGIGGLAVDHLLRRLNIHPDLAGGHSYGELVALCVAGAYDARTLLTLSSERAKAILDAAGADPGTMAAVSASVEQVTGVLADAGLAGDVVLANNNAATQQVISGPSASVRIAAAALDAAGLSVQALPVACAFHSPVVAAATDRFAQILATRPVQPPGVPVWSNRTAAAYPTDDADAIRAELAAQIGAPVRFADQIHAMYAAGARVFVEAGPGQILTRLIPAILGDLPHLAVACDRNSGEGLRDLLIAVAQLACAGVPVQTGWLFRGRDIAEVHAAEPHQGPIWTVDGQLVRDRDGNCLRGGMTPPRRIKELSMTTTIPTNAGDSAGRDGGREGRDELVEFLRTSREMIASHRDVMLAYLGNGNGGRHMSEPTGVYEQLMAMPTNDSAVPVSPAPATTGPSVPFSPDPISMPDTNAPVPTDGVLTASVSTASASPPPASTASALPRATGSQAVFTDAAPAVSAATLEPHTSINLGFQRDVLAVISDRTGYPVDLIDLDSDLEADLSVDSIKRAEIAGEVAARLGLSTEADESQLERLVGARTVRAMVDSLTAAGAAEAANGALAADGALAANYAAVPNDDTLADGAGDSRGAVALAAPPTEPKTAEFRDTVLAVISERTGYPVDLIDLDSDLEADLSVDSIKRAEIAGEVATRLGLSTEADESQVEVLVGARTVRAILDSLTGRVNSAAAPGSDGQRLGVAPRRLVPTLVPIADAPVAQAKALAGATLLVTGGGPVAVRLAELLTTHGATVRTGTLGTDEAALADGVDGLIILDGLTDGEAPLLPGAFGLVKQILTGSARWVLAVDASAGACADGLRGLFRTITREYPLTNARLVTVDGNGEAEQVARQLLDELLTGGDVPVVDRTGAGRRTYDLVPVGLGPLATGGAGPAGDGVAEARAVGLDRDSVVVIVGGARGITPWFASALASASRCRIELIGRTALPDGEQDPELAKASDAAAVRAALARRGMRSPAEIARAAQAILAGREVEATLRELRGRGSEVRYHTLDVRDEEATHQLLKAIHSEYGRIDGLVYAAGVIEDKLIAEKDPESFARVFDTKVDGARAVLDALDDICCAPRFVVLFGSIAAVYGNRGQCDYAAANDALDATGARWAARTGNRCLTVHWGPWAPGDGHGGMVTAELGREYARRGVALIDPEEGALSLLGELAWGDPGITSVVYTASGW